MLNKGASNEELAARKAQDSFGVDDLLLIKLEERDLASADLGYNGAKFDLGELRFQAWDSLQFV